MKVIKSISETQALCMQFREEKKTIAFVPTMGALHEGHLSLCREGRKRGDVLVVSIFVNPTQFGQAEDLDAYPRDMEGDVEKLVSCGTDLVFAPSASQMYPEGFQTYVEVTQVSKGLCGAFRPGHFRGVATVVLKLFNIVKPHIALFGEKDYQQMHVIKRMLRDLNMNIEIIGMPVVRERDGLALSSRNSYLSSEEREQATCLYLALTKAKELFQQGERNPQKLVKAATEIIKARGLAKIDYVELRNAVDLTQWKDNHGAPVMLMAVRVGKTRLIDNMKLAAKI